MVNAARIFGIAVLMASYTADAGTSCFTYNGAGYCQYDGRVSRVYMNSGGLILIYFEQAFDPGQAASVGVTGVSTGSACMYSTTPGFNLDYARMLYSSALSAQARGATVSMQLWGQNSGYMVCDRIWVNE